MQYKKQELYNSLCKSDLKQSTKNIKDFKNIIDNGGVVKEYTYYRIKVKTEEQLLNDNPKYKDEFPGWNTDMLNLQGKYIEGYFKQDVYYKVILFVVNYGEYNRLVHWLDLNTMAGIDNPN